MWKKFLVPSDSSLVLSLDNQMVAAGNISPKSLGLRIYGCGTSRGRVLATIERTPKICLYSPFTQTWVQVGDFLDGYAHRVFSGRSPLVESLYLQRDEVHYSRQHSRVRTQIHFCNEVAGSRDQLLWSSG